MHAHAHELTFHKSSYSNTARECVEVAAFRKSTYSQPRQNCVEVARFRKSTYSNTARECVEVADLPSGAAVRDTQNRGLGTLAFPTSEWAAFLRLA
ncbi:MULTISPECIES: DUF397 domain-containing protein [unclassified Nocardiopsis]|uniref:DUF397 domain-containing protein n=1 Tax=unclassified Nocardiopsis TaxID=2649073 RepID=UPI000B164389|nr:MULTISPECIES: DUF397 domain-containing protein [unclassified Nocardiopsis]MBQ1083070.1 DUF397 domain-containing protein [Nocardiopsis sp. B62]